MSRLGVINGQRWERTEDRCAANERRASCSFEPSLFRVVGSARGGLVCRWFDRSGETSMNRLAPGFVLSACYQLVGQVAAGGMTQVWSAVYEVLQRTVAVKIMHPQTPERHAMAERFQAEARVAAQISHPNIVEVFDFAEHDGLAFLEMEFVDGPTLAELLVEQGRLPPDRARLIPTQLAGALSRAHDNGIIHRDLKPLNVAISPNGYAKLMDFGIANDMNGASLATTGEISGTAYYISPEQALG